MGSKGRILASLTLLACFTGASNKAKADTLVINAPVGGFFVSYANGFAQDTLSIPSTSAPLSYIQLANYTDVDFHISAPAGQLITLTQNATFSFNFVYHNYDDAATSTPCSFTYTGTGPAPGSSSPSCSVGTGGHFIGYTFSDQFFAGDSFSALDFNLAIPNNLPKAGIANFVYQPYQSEEFTFSDQTNTNPGSFVSFTTAPAVAPTPEPSSLMLLGTGILGVAGAARRRFKR